MIEKIMENGVYNTKVDQFVVDTVTEVAQLPDATFASICFCIEDSSFYMKSTTGWVKI